MTRRVFKELENSISAAIADIAYGIHKNFGP